MACVPPVFLRSSLSGSVISYICVCSLYVQRANILVASNNCFLLYALHFSVLGVLFHVHILFQDNGKCSKKRPQKGVLQGLQLVRKVSFALWLSSFSSCIFFHSSWFFHAVQVFGLWCLNWSITLIFNERISPLENDSPSTVFASFSTILVNKTSGSALLFSHGQSTTCWDRISLPG